MNRYIVDTQNKNDYTAGSKARDDIKNILNSVGFQDITIQIGENKKNVIREVTSIKSQLEAKLSGVESNSFILFQYPWPTMSFEFAKIIKRVASKKKLTTIAVIHDLNSVRTGSSLTRLYYNNYVKEIKYLDCFDHIICHNEKMKQYLVGKGIAASKIVCLELFDYLLDNSDDESQHDTDFHTLSIAGNLSPEKTKYIYELVDSGLDAYALNLYGPFYEGKTSDHVRYRGQFPASSLPYKITNGFGLVWDGDSADTCTGHFGEYLKINNPHKLSLYMACGVPAFVWKEAAVADFVKKYQVGICIEHLSDIDTLMSSITEADYADLKKNAETIHSQVTSGYFIKKALSAINKDLIG